MSRHDELVAWRKLTLAERMAHAAAKNPDPLPPSANPTSLDPIVRDKILACPDRGSTLSVAELKKLGCGCPELSVCRAGKGKIPGKVSLRECITCKT